MVDSKEKITECPKSEDDHAPYGDSKKNFLEYELDLEVGGDFFKTLIEP